MTPRDKCPTGGLLNPQGSSRLSTCPAWNFLQRVVTVHGEGKTFAYPLPYLEHVSSGEGPRGKLHPQFLIKPWRGQKALLNVGIKWTSTSGKSSSARRHRNRGRGELEQRGPKRTKGTSRRRGQREEGRKVLSSFHCKCQVQDFRHRCRPCPRRPPFLKYWLRTPWHNDRLL